MDRARRAPIDAEHDACGIAVVADRRGRPSREILDRGLEALARLAHRGAVDDRGRSSDGAGVLTEIPWTLVADDLPAAFGTPGARRIAGTFTLDPAQADAARAAADTILRRCGWRTICWRLVPVQVSALSVPLRPSAPVFMHAFAVAEHPPSARSPYRTRLAIEARWQRLGVTGCSIASLSDRTIVYKALADPAALPRLFRDLADPRFATAFAVAHQRFSTNTWPRWELAQPFHSIAHNGEINTIRGNRLWMEARLFESNGLHGSSAQDCDVVRRRGSDSQTLDAAVEWLRETGVSTPRALARLLPAAWEHDDHLPERMKAFYRHEACFAEPWEGPAALAFADGRHVGAVVDRNGFRPLRTLETDDGLVCLASEAGVFDIPAATVTARGRLGPGEMIVADLETGIVRHGADARHHLADQTDYTARAATYVRRVPPSCRVMTSGAQTGADLHSQHQLFGWTREELELIVKALACDGHEAVGSMGDDATLAALSSRTRPLSDYFRQRFAQVTNPPLDPLRESSVMSLRVLLGRRGTWGADSLEPMLLEVNSPVLREEDFAAICAQHEVRATTVPIGFVAGQAPGAGLHEALDVLQRTVMALASNGTRIIVLSDRRLDPPLTPIPPLLAIAAVDTALRDRRLRLRVSVVVETGEVRDAHQIAVLCGFGASAVLPYLLCATAQQVNGADGPTRCRAALEAGLLKVMSKMGVCTFDAYVGGRLFDAIGLERALADAYFPGCLMLPGRLTLDDLAMGAAERKRSMGSIIPLAHPGFHMFRHSGDHHAFNPALVRQLHQAVEDVRLKAEGTPDGTDDRAQAYRAFAELVEARPANALRDLVHAAPREPVRLDEVEPVEAICRRFFTSAMSVGALSPEAHRTLAAAMNSLGCRSNTGEGGEEPERLVTRGAASTRSATKQVASARFGVTPAYLISATELQIKMAQGSKPGEGGQLPAAKVDGLIARLRYAQPGMMLISPPPHHDIYSIEDLAQLIYDLRTFHPRARINVKLVSQPGIGVVAAGVVKAGADAIQISGHEGGTGASPRSSIKHAGAPWEIGLAEAHRVLVSCGLRDRVVLQTDGGLQTGRDLIIAAALGAEEFGFGTAALVAIGCVMARQCHLNTCPVGIASQRPDLRARFAGTPDMLVRYLRLIAQDVRERLAALGLRTVAELVGRADLLAARSSERALDVTPLLVRTEGGGTQRRRPRARAAAGELNRALARAARGQLGTAPVTFIGRVKNTDRAVGVALAGRLAAQRGNAGTAHAPVELRLTGSAGQSLWAFALPGMHVRLEGEANDGVGKGMHGGEIVIRPPGGSRVVSPVLVGNAALYGATGGRMFVAGRAGERFAVRNSGAWAVVEGVGDHACEYMTGGTVLVLGPAGRNFAAGMTGGVAYLLEGTDGHVAGRINRGSVQMQHGLGTAESWVRAWLIEHHERTGSAIAADLLRHWPTARERFRVVLPTSDVERVTGPAPMPHRVAPASSHARAASASSLVSP